MLSTRPTDNSSSLLPRLRAARVTAFPDGPTRARLARPDMLAPAAASRATPPPCVALYKRGGRVALLDDDPDFVEAMRLVVPPSWGLRTFLSPVTCLNHLQQEPPHWEADMWAQQELVSRWHGGAPMIPLILRYWATTPDRCSLTKVLVTDYNMPGRDGLDTLRDLVNWPGHRVLMTGAFDERLAVDAFNAGLIHHFIEKQRRDLTGSLLGAVDALIARPIERYTQIWSAALRPPQMQTLRDPVVAAELQGFLAASFMEWMVIGDPFGVIGLDASGRVHWVQLETERNLGELAEIAAAAGATASLVAEVRAGRRLSNAELRRGLGLPGSDFPQALSVGENTGVLAAVTRIGVRDGQSFMPPLNAFSYSLSVSDDSRP